MRALEFDYEPTTRPLWMKGPYGRGSATALRSALAQHPRATTLAVVGPGGFVIEAEAMVQMITERGMDTYAPGRCASACVSVFSAEQQRWIGPETWIGPHRSGHECIADTGPSRSDEEDALFFLSRGVSQWLVDTMLETPHVDILVPSHARLLASSMATGSR